MRKNPIYALSWPCLNFITIWHILLRQFWISNLENPLLRKNPPHFHKFCLQVTKFPGHPLYIPRPAKTLKVNKIWTVADIGANLLYLLLKSRRFHYLAFAHFDSWIHVLFNLLTLNLSLLCGLFSTIFLSPFTCSAQKYPIFAMCHACGKI